MSTTPDSHQPYSADPAKLLAAAEADISALFNAMDWADDEIAAACRRHRTQRDLLHHAFSVLKPRDIGSGMNSEFVYRSHVRELLDRVADGADLSSATAAEVCLTLAAVSSVVPLHAAATGLYLRMWLAAFPGHPFAAEHAGTLSHYEHLYGPQIDELEAVIRRKVADPERQLGDIECSGLHHGRAVACRFTCSHRRTP